MDESANYRMHSIICCSDNLRGFLGYICVPTENLYRNFIEIYNKKVYYEHVEKLHKNMINFYYEIFSKLDKYDIKEIYKKMKEIIFQFKNDVINIVGTKNYDKNTSTIHFQNMYEKHIEDNLDFFINEDVFKLINILKIMKSEDIKIYNDIIEHFNRIIESLMENINVTNENILIPQLTFILDFEIVINLYECIKNKKIIFISCGLNHIQNLHINIMFLQNIKKIYLERMLKSTYNYVDIKIEYTTDKNITDYIIKNLNFKQVDIIKLGGKLNINITQCLIVLIIILVILILYYLSYDILIYGRTEDSAEK